MENRVLKKLKEILKKVQHEDMLDVVYTATKELIINATKANIKRIIFAENNLDIDDPTDWELGTAIFRDKLLSPNFKEYFKKARILNFKVITRYIYTKHGLRIDVVNNTPISKFDEERLREKLREAMQYKSLADFYMDYSDNTEGSGLGLALVVILLKNQGIDPQYLRIGKDGDTTVARLEIPFSDAYVPYREIKYKKKLKENQGSITVDYDFSNS